MDGNRSSNLLRMDSKIDAFAAGESTDSFPRVFRHSKIFRSLEDAPRIACHFLINKLNHLHFENKHVLVHLRHPTYEDFILVRARPDPVTGNELTCRWDKEEAPPFRWHTYMPLHVLVDDGSTLIAFPAVFQQRTVDSFTVRLPDECFCVGKRLVRRYRCEGDVSAKLSQSGFAAGGVLIDFSPVGFRIRLMEQSVSSYEWFNPDMSANVQLSSGSRVFLNSECECVREVQEDSCMEIVMAPMGRSIRRFRKRKIRNPRQRLSPSPSLVFDHPLVGRRFQLDVADMSTSGFSVVEKPGEEILTPGMIIPGLIIDFSGALQIRCEAQVIYRSERTDEGTRCGIAILDMDIADYSLLSGLLAHALDPHFFAQNPADAEKIWEFFFDSGFIYPAKYTLIQSARDVFKENYRRVFENHPEIGKHFTYQENGRIHAHIALVKAYERAWLIQHHSSRMKGRRRTGFLVLKQIMHYLNDMHRLPCSGMDYAMTYFRPENRIPQRIFGDFVESLVDPGASSVDLFHYLPFPRPECPPVLPSDWALGPCTASDLWEFTRFYNHVSGGLLLKAMDVVGKGSFGPVPGGLEAMYENAGLLRRVRFHALHRDEGLNAVFVEEKCELGVNLSGLLDSIKVFVVKPEEMRWDILLAAVARLSKSYEKEVVPVLLYPPDWVDETGIPSEKTYRLWILNVRHADRYMEYMDERFRISFE